MQMNTLYMRVQLHEQNLVVSLIKPAKNTTKINLWGILINY